MEQRHRDLLCANSFEITSDLRFRDIREYLLDKGVLSEDNLNEIESKKSRVDQAKALLDILPTRGPHAFSVFRDALKLHYPHLARLLNDESQQEPFKGGETPEPRIFIIHAGEDKEHFVRPLVSALKDKGLEEDDIFFDEISIKPGEHIRERIMSTLSSDALQVAVIVVSTSLLNKNYWPKLELEKCLNKKCLFPIWLDENEDNFKAFSELVGNYSPTLKQMSARRVQRTSVENELANIATEVVQQLSALEKSQPSAMQMLLYAAPTSARSADSVSSDEETSSKDDGTGASTDDEQLIEEILKERKRKTDLEMLGKWGEIQLKLIKEASGLLSKEKVEQQTEEMFAQLRQKFDILMVKVGCAIVHIVPNNVTDLDSFWVDYKSGKLSEELSHRLITDEMRALVGQDLVVQVIMLEEQYWRWRKHLTEMQDLQGVALTPIAPVREPSTNTTSHEGLSEQTVDLTSFYEAVATGNMETVKRELQAGAEVRVKREWDFVDDQSPLHVASRHGQTAVAELLVQHGADLEARDGLLQQTPLHIATKQGHTATSEVLIRFGADIMAQDKLQQTPLHVAANWDYTGTSELLIYSGADLMAGDKLQQTPLHLAALKGHAKTAQLLIRCGANVNAMNKYQRTCLHLAAAEGHPGICELLIKSGANVMARDVEQKTPLHLAAARGRTKIAETLIQSGADIMAKDEEQQTPLHRAAHWGHSGTSEHLIRHNADVTAKDKKQNTPLHLAAIQGHSESCRLLIHSEANVMAKNWERKTPLHLAAIRGHTEICTHLIRSGVDVMAKDKDGKTPLDFAPDQETWRYWKSLYKQGKKGVQEKIYNELLQKYGGVKVDRCKIFLCGKERTGKSTLRNSLQQDLIPGFLQDLLTKSDHHEPTPGIDIGTFHVPGVGEVSMWDFAGQSEYGVTHTMLMDAENTIFIVMYDITDDIETQQQQVRYWLSFIKSCSPTRQPDVILVASHQDKVELSKGEGQAFNVLELMKAEFKDHLHISDDVFLMDCRKTRTPEMDRLKSLLARIKADLLQHQHEIPKLCAKITKHLPKWCKTKTSPKFPVMMWPDYLDAVKEIDPHVTEDFLEKSTGFLHSLGEVLFICPGTCDPIIILEPNWLSTDILGTMMAPENFPIAPKRTSEGCITKAEMLRVFQDLADVDLLITLLQEVLLCHTYDGHTFIVPGLLTQIMPPDKWQPTNEPNAVYFGKQIQCAGSTDMFSPGFFPRVQTCFMREMVNHPLMWKDGIKCVDRDVEGLIKISENSRALNICVRSTEGDRRQCSKMLQHLENIIAHMLDEYSPGTSTVEKVLSARALKEHREDFYSYGKEDIREGRVRGGTVVHPILGFTEWVSDLLCEEDDPFIMYRLELIQALRHVEPILDHLLVHNILNLEEYDVMIRADKTPQERARRLLDILVTKGEYACEVFMSILREVAPHAAEILK